MTYPLSGAIFHLLTPQQHMTLELDLGESRVPVQIGPGAKG